MEKRLFWPFGLLGLFILIMLGGLFGFIGLWGWQILFFSYLLPLISAIFSLVNLISIKRRNMPGKNLALSSLIISLIIFFLFLIGFFFGS